MEEKVEITPIAIPEIHYNRYIANLIEQLLLIDEKLFKEKPEVSK